MATTDLTTAADLDMTGDAWNLSILRGDTYEFDGQMLLDDEAETPVNLTGYLIICGVKRNKWDKDYISMWDTPITNENEGRYKLILSHAESMKMEGGLTADEKASLYYWDCKLYTLANAFVRTVWSGELKVLRNVSVGV